MTENEDIEKILYMGVGRSGIDNENSKIAKALNELMQYRAIGTVKGYECAIESSIENYNLYREYKAKVQEFETIGAVEEFKDLKEKSVAKKPLRVPTDDTCLYYEFRCPSCGVWLSREIKRTHCKCNQKLDWQ